MTRSGWDDQTVGSPLSWMSVRSVDWSKLLDATAGLVQLAGGEESTSLPQVSPEVEKVIRAAKKEFGEASRRLNRLRNILVLVSLLAIGAAVAGFISLGTKETGIWTALLFGGEQSILFVAVVTLWNLARDEVRLSLFPAKYELAFGLCTTLEQRNLVFQSFIKELDDMRGPAPVGRLRSRS